MELQKSKKGEQQIVEKKAKLNDEESTVKKRKKEIYKKEGKM